MPEELPRVAGVRFRNAGRIFYFHTAGMRLEPGEFVVVETTRGPEVAKVVIAPGQVVVNELGREDLKPILRLATEADIRKADELRRKAEELLPEARRLGEELGFPAHIDGAEFTLDGRRLTFSFTSEERIDYREFVKRAGDRFKARVEMRQMGPRDRARQAGGYGICGRELCCSSWLATFPSISIRMAKEQDLPLNPQKISGLCGRLLCCLSYEEEGYNAMRKSLPRIGQRCSTPTGEGKVIAINILRRQVTLVVDGQRIEVGDRDLGTVVRWDTASKSGEPPPSISRADAIAQGLIEATEEDLRAAARKEAGEDWLDEGAAFEPGPGRGRLPGGGPRRVVPARPPRGEPPKPGGQEQPAGRQQPARRRGGQPAQQPQQPRREPRQERPAQRPTSTPANAAEGRVFRRGGQGPEDATRQPRPPRDRGGERPRQAPPPAQDSAGAGEEPRSQRSARRRRRGRGGGGSAPPPAG
ncbi:MAG: hypothetical protein AMXMBFR80_03880 [Dehalococcoidia bacterium]